MNNTFQQKVFDKCVRVYLAYSKPVGSRLLKRKCFKSFGESTIRLYLNRLVKEGYLENLPDFSGRVPTDFGWRQFYLRNRKKIKIDEKIPLSLEGKDLLTKINLVSKENRVYYLLRDRDGHLEEGGLDFILENVEFEVQKMIYNFASFLKGLKENMKDIVKNIRGDLVLYIGGEIPLKYKESTNFSIIFKKLTDKILCFVSIKRQNYPYFVQLIDRVFNDRGARKITPRK